MMSALINSIFQENIPIIKKKKSKKKIIFILFHSIFDIYEFLFATTSSTVILNFYFCLCELFYESLTYNIN